MELVLEFDLDADIVDVPKAVVDNRELIRKRFLRWIYNKHTNQRFRVTLCDHRGNKITGVKFRGDAFVEWLNNKVLDGGDEKAIVIQQHVGDYPSNLPSIFF